jgi:hypothetical protein
MGYSKKEEQPTPRSKTSHSEIRAKGRRKKSFQTKSLKNTQAEENGISNRQKYPSFISPLTVLERPSAKDAQPDPLLRTIPMAQRSRGAGKKTRTNPYENASHIASHSA